MKIPILRIPYEEVDIRFIQDQIGEILCSGNLAMGKNVKLFEKLFAEFTGTKYAIAVNSGTSALEILLRSIDVRGKSVIVPTNTFMATATSVVHAGAKVIFTDIMRENLCMDPDSLQENLQKDTAAVILVHIGGIITHKLKEIQKICSDANIPLFEDSAHAHGSEISGKKAGNLGSGSSFSFYPTKVLTTGEGGMITTNDYDIYKKTLILRDHGKEDHMQNIHTEFGYNWRMSEIHGVLGVQQMKQASTILSERRRIAQQYNERLKGSSGIELLAIPADIKSSYYKYIAYLDSSINRSDFKLRLLEEYQIHLTGEVYANPCHSQPVFSHYPETIVTRLNNDYPNARYVCNHHICLPLYPGLTEKEVDYICMSIRELTDNMLQKK